MKPAGSIDVSWRAWLALGLLTLGLLGAWLGRLDLLDPDEGRHAEIAREMLASHSFITPRLQGEPYYHKPVAFHWTVAASLATLGRSAAAARLPSVLATIVMLLATAYWARGAYSPKVAWLAVTGLVTTPFVIVIGRLATLDMLFTASLTAALAWLGLWFIDPPTRRRSPYPFYALVGVATLVKGPAAIVLCGGVAFMVVVATGNRNTFAALSPFRGGLLTLAVAAPWYVAAWMTDPAYIETFLLRHNIARYAGGGSIGHQQGWWYYPTLLPASLLPWTPLVIAALVIRLRRPSRTGADLYCALWAGTVVAFFLPASTKLVTYMLPAFPPLATLTARFAHDRWNERPLHRRVALHRYALGWSISVAVIAVAVAAIVAWRSSQPVFLRAWLIAPAVVVPFWLWRGRDEESWIRRPLAAMAVSSAAVVLTCYGLASDLFNAGKSTRPAAEIVAAELPGQADLASFHCFQHALAFYSGRTVRKARTAEEAVAGLLGTERAALLTKDKYLDNLGLRPLPAGVTLRWEGGPGCILLWKNGHATVLAPADENMAEKGGSRTLRRPPGPASRF